MKRFTYLLAIILTAYMLTSCGASKTQNTKQDRVTYTLKDKKELVKQRILNQKRNTVLATP